ncbi:MAG TPA: lysophospholipid acyltransferase family protein [Acetobacteraceae bacterium]|jgi:hypothetical protein
MKRVLRHPIAQAVLAWLLGQYLAFALATTRWRFEGIHHIEPLLSGETAVVAFWHRRLALMPTLWTYTRRQPSVRATRRIHVLVSQHADGRFIGDVLRRFHVQVVHGSSSRGGAGALRSMLRLLRRGDFVVITPDGPLGPAGEAAPGVAQLAGLADVPVVPCAAQTSRHWVLRTWDRTLVPKPFGRGVMVCGPPIHVPRDGWEAALPAITAALNAAAEHADRLCAT